MFEKKTAFEQVQLRQVEIKILQWLPIRKVKDMRPRTERTGKHFELQSMKPVNTRG